MKFAKHQPFNNEGRCDDFIDSQYWLYDTMLEQVLSNSHHDGIINECHP